MYILHGIATHRSEDYTLKVQIIINLLFSGAHIIEWAETNENKLNCYVKCHSAEGDRYENRRLKVIKAAPAFAHVMLF